MSNQNSPDDQRYEMARRLAEEAIAKALDEHIQRTLLEGNAPNIRYRLHFGIAQRVSVLDDLFPVLWKAGRD